MHPGSLDVKELLPSTISSTKLLANELVGSNFSEFPLYYLGSRLQNQESDIDDPISSAKFL